VRERGGEKESKRENVEKEAERKKRKRSTHKECAYGTKSRAPLSYQRACVRVVTGSPLRAFPVVFPTPARLHGAATATTVTITTTTTSTSSTTIAGRPRAWNPFSRTRRSVRARSPACGMQQMHRT